MCQRFCGSWKRKHTQQHYEVGIRGGQKAKRRMLAIGRVSQRALATGMCIVHETHLIKLSALQRRTMSRTMCTFLCIRDANNTERDDVAYAGCPAVTQRPNIQHIQHVSLHAHTVSLHTFISLCMMMMRRRRVGTSFYAYSGVLYFPGTQKADIAHDFTSCVNTWM